MESAVDESEKLLPMLRQMISCPEKHLRWLNTLSYLENCGARKIAACEHPTKVPRQMLKHAAEEFRHAYYLKQQMQRLGVVPFESYHIETLFGRYSTLHYLNKLDVAVCRLLKNSYKLSSNKIKEVAYLLVTYAIEVRASKLYPAYQQALLSMKSKVSVRSIIAEEDHHLAEMKEELDKVLYGHEMGMQACHIEQMLFDRWSSIVFNT